MNSIRRGDVLLVTGATGAIGFEIARQAAAGGAVVAMHGSTRQSVADAVNRLRALVPEAMLIAVPADFRVGGAIETMVSLVIESCGKLDAVVHCAITAPGGVTGPFEKTTPTNFAPHATMILGNFQLLCFTAMPHLARQGGTIVGFASDAGRFAAPRQALIGAAFGGIMTFVRNLALEVARQNVRIHCVSPSFVAGTPAFELHAARAGAARERAGLGLPEPADIAPMVLFLCSAGASKITGQVISINGGMNA